MKTVFPSFIVFPTQHPRIYVSVLLALFMFYLILVSPTLAAAQDVESTPEVTLEVPVDESPIDEPAEPPADEQPPVEEPPAPVIDVIPIERAAELLLAAISAIIGGALLQAPITTFLVSLLKRVPFLNGVGGGALAFVVAGFLTVAVWLSRAFGLEVQLDSAFNVIVVAGPAILNLLATLTGSSALYNVAKNQSVPIIGYERPKRLSAASFNSRGSGRFETVREPDIDGKF
jgi:uncharacterized membrane protein YedE/YeeE